MKQSEIEKDLSEYLSLLGIQPGAGELGLLARHVLLVEDANQRLNITRITAPADAVRRHVADSLVVLEDVGIASAGRMLDLGSGGGFPGIPLAICTGRDVDLVDSVAKKVRELESMVRALGLGEHVRAIASRAEALARTRPGEYAVVVARAVSELPALVELASPLLEPGGRLICLKGTPDDDEVKRAEKAAALVGMRPEYRRFVALPEDVGSRTVFVYRKTGPSQIPLPRREGMAQHSPLA